MKTPSHITAQKRGNEHHFKRREKALQHRAFCSKTPPSRAHPAQLLLTQGRARSSSPAHSWCHRHHLSPVPLTGIRPPLRTQTAADTHLSPTLLRRSVSQEAFSCQHSSEPLSQQQDGSSGHSGAPGSRRAVRAGRALPRSTRNWGGPGHTGLGSTALLSAELSRAPLPARTSSGTGTETPRSHRTNGPGWRPRQRGVHAAAAGNLCTQSPEKRRRAPAVSSAWRNSAPPAHSRPLPAPPGVQRHPQPSFRRGSANGPAALRSGPASAPRSPPSKLPALSRRGRPYAAPVAQSAAAPGVYRARGPPRPARLSASGQSRPRSAWGSAARPCAAPPGCEGSGVACAAPAPVAAGQRRLRGGTAGCVTSPRALPRCRIAGGSQRAP